MRFAYLYTQRIFADVCAVGIRTLVNSHMNCCSTRSVQRARNDCTVTFQATVLHSVGKVALTHLGRQNLKSGK